MSDSGWSLLVHERARQRLNDLDGSVRERVSSALDELKQAPEQRTKPLSGSLKGARTYRIGTPSGEYRILLVLEPTEKIIKIYYVGPREDFYDTVRRLFE